jgi:phospholipase C
MASHNKFIAVSLMATRAAGFCLLAGAGFAGTSAADDYGDTTTPIKHLVVIFQENVSFDHYFATYPTALNLPGEPIFLATTRHQSTDWGPWSTELPRESC